MKKVTAAETAQKQCAHWRDLANRAFRDGRSYFTPFVSVEMCEPAKREAALAGVDCVSWGGVPETGRVMLCFTPDSASIQPTQFPISCLTIRYRKCAALCHRDFLGAFLACGLERETIGDILISEGLAQAFVMPPAAAVLAQELCLVGNTGVCVSTEELPLLSATQNFSKISGTVASLRADAVTAMVAHVSREKAAQLIRQGKVSCHGVMLENLSAPMHAGDVFSIRGYGKFRLETVDGLTRKGRYHITIFQYQ